MKVTARTTFVVSIILVAHAFATYRPVLAQAPAKVAPMHVHHVT